MNWHDELRVNLFLFARALKKMIDKEKNKHKTTWMVNNG